jgi:hypothetical protein
MKKSCILSPLLLLLAFVFAGCEKDNQLEDGLIPVYCEPLGNGTKVSVIDDVKSRWVEGDEISINGQTIQVLFSNGQACVRYTADANSVNRAVYPASMVGEGTSFASDAIEVTFPAEYHYREADGHQQIEIPMVAKSTGTDALEFKHLTGALCVQLYNNSGAEVLVRSVTIASDNSQLSGPCTVDVSTAAITTRVAEPTTAQKKVTLHFDHGLKVTNGNTRKVLIPVLPVGDGNHFTVTVDFCQPSELSHAFRFTKTQPSGGALPRNILGYAKTELVTSGEGISNQPLVSFSGQDYYISAPLDFILLSQAINAQAINSFSVAFDKHYYAGNIYLQNDIDMLGYSISPIKGFEGVFDGNGYTISNLTINSIFVSTGYFCGMFYHNKTGKTVQIKDITLDNITLLHAVNTEKGLTVGAIFAVVGGPSTIENCNVNIKEVKNTGTVSGSLYFGGMIGELESGNTDEQDIVFNYCDVNIQSTSLNNNSSIYYGSFVGICAAKYHTQFNHCTCNVNVELEMTSGVRVGGLIGQKSYDKFTANNCQLNGTVSAVVGSNYNYWGNLVGRYFDPKSYNLFITNNTYNLYYYQNEEAVSPIAYYSE